MPTCRRCRQQTNITTMSRFNTDIICPSCEEREIAHPKYPEAAEAELRAVRAGNYNFKGIGCPPELYVCT